MSAIEEAREFLRPVPGAISTLHIYAPHAQRMIDEYDSLAREAEFVKTIIRRGWSDHMWNFEHMDERDENWLRRWAGMEWQEEPPCEFPPDAPPDLTLSE